MVFETLRYSEVFNQRDSARKRISRRFTQILPQIYANN